MKRLWSFWFWTAQNSKFTETLHWYPTKCFLPNSDSRIGLVILNGTALTKDSDETFIEKLWPKAKIRACADGGTNRLMQLNQDHSLSLCPEIICGDFDSVRPEILDIFKKQGVQIHRDSRDDATDCTKCARLVSQELLKRNEQVDCLVVNGGLCGRFDHVMGSLNTMFILQEEFPKLPVYFVQHYSVATLLPAGNHILHIDRNLTTGVCGLVPLGQTAKSVSTTGLKYNLNNSTMRFGELISSSNAIESNEVTVNSDAQLLWIIQLTKDWWV